MGCSAPGGFLFGMFGGRGRADADAESRARLERKMCLARESPDDAFDLSSCSLRAVPAGVYSLCRVFRKRALDLRDNRLRRLEDGGDLADLFLVETLSVASNRLRELTADVRHLRNLRELRLEDNELEALPDAIGELAQLRVLDASRNALRSLPAALGALQRLKRLALRGNPDLKTLRPELCGARQLREIEVDADNLIHPPAEISRAGTVDILRFLCAESGVAYEAPTEDSDDVDSLWIDSAYDSSRRDELERCERLKAEVANREAHEDELRRSEAEATRKQRERLLFEFARDRDRLDSELNKIQHEKDSERSSLVKRIREEEEATAFVVDKLSQASLSNPLRIQRFLEHDQREHDRLLELCRTNYDALKKADTLRAMESLLREECEYEKSLKSYGDNRSEVKRSFLLDELEDSHRLVDAIESRDRLQANFVESLLDDETIQKAAVGALLEKCDARTWGLVQEISLVEAQLAKLSVMELGRRKLELNENLDNLAEHRIQLSSLLIDLLDQRETRRVQLVETLRDMEMEKKNSTDFWLIRYQQLLDALPGQMVSSQRKLDPIFANRLLQEGVIHCLPFLISKVSSRRDLEELNDKDLRRLGVQLSNDRANILKAIKLYIEELRCTENKIEEAVESDNYRPSAPSEMLTDSNEPTAPSVAALSYRSSSECVVCMDDYSVVVFIPCGHLCCCLKCSSEIHNSCPMCRQDIERKIRIIPQ